VLSTAGILTTAEASTLFKLRAEEIVPKRTAIMEEVIQAKGFPKSAETTMKDINSFHACYLDSWP